MLFAALADSPSHLSFAGHGGTGRVDPKCACNYEDTTNLLTRVDPTATGPTFTPTPVRIIGGTDGSVKYVHVISAIGGRRDSIETNSGRPEPSNPTETVVGSTKPEPTLPIIGRNAGRYHGGEMTARRWP